MLILGQVRLIKGQLCHAGLSKGLKLCPAGLEGAINRKRYPFNSFQLNNPRYSIKPGNASDPKWLLNDVFTLYIQSIAFSLKNTFAIQRCASFGYDILVCLQYVFYFPISFTSNLMLFVMCNFSVLFRCLHIRQLISPKLNFYYNVIFCFSPFVLPNEIFKAITHFSN